MLKSSQQLRSLLLSRDDSFGDKGQKWQFDELRVETSYDGKKDHLQKLYKRCEKSLTIGSLFSGPTIELNLLSITSPAQKNACMSSQSN